MAAFCCVCHRLSVGTGFEGGIAEGGRWGLVPVRILGWLKEDLGKDEGTSVAVEPDLLPMFISHNNSGLGMPVDGVCLILLSL